MKERITKTLTATAYHEAGHVVAAISHRIPFRFVTIVPDDGEGFLGRMEGRADPSFDCETCDPNSGRTKLMVERQVVCSLAGPEAERAFAGRCSRAGAAGDYSDAVRWAELVHGNAKVLEAYLRFLTELTRCWVRTPGPNEDIKAVADALLEHRKLSSAAVRKVLRESRLRFSIG